MGDEAIILLQQNAPDAEVSFDVEDEVVSKMYTLQHCILLLFLWHKRLSNVFGLNDVVYTPFGEEGVFPWEPAKGQMTRN